ncbi:eukaryotic translation initiation factor 6-2 [Tanacetum coccineum]
MTKSSIFNPTFICFVTFTELQHLRNNLLDAVVVQWISERLSALGNCMACNDHVALTHTDRDKVTKLDYMIRGRKELESLATASLKRVYVENKPYLVGRSVVRSLCSVFKVHTLTDDMDTKKTYRRSGKLVPTNFSWCKKGPNFLEA